MSPLTFGLEQLLGAWKTQLQEWSADGSLVAAAREAFLLSDVPQELERLAGQWSLGDFSGLPPIEVLQGEVLPGAAGAYAVSTGTIYLNGDWLATASEQQVIGVLTEELGHHLDGLLKLIDTPGDEGDRFSVKVSGKTIATELFASDRNEVDTASLELDGIWTELEMSAFVPVQRDVYVEVINPESNADPGSSDPFVILPVSIVIDGASSLSDLSGLGRILYTIWDTKDVISIFFDLQSTISQDKSDWELAESRQKFIRDLVATSVNATLGIFLPPGINAAAIVAFKVAIDNGIAKPIADSISVPLAAFENYYGKIPVADALAFGTFDSFPEIRALADEYQTGLINRQQFDQRLQDLSLYQQFLDLIDSRRNGADDGVPQQGSGRNSMFLDADGKLYFRSGVETFTGDIGQLADFDLYLDGATLSGVLDTQLVWLRGFVHDLTISENGRLLTTNDSQSSLIYTGNILNQGYVEHVYRDFDLLFGNGAIGARFVNEGVYALIGTTYLYDFLNPGRSIFINRGLVRRSGSGETQVAMKFENQGTVEVVEGALNFFTDQIHTGRYIAQGGSVNFSGGLHTLTDNVIFEGENYNFIGGVLTGGKFTQRLNWQSGTINDLTIGENGRLLTTNDSQSSLIYTGNILNQGYVEHVYRDFGLLFGNGAIGARFVNEGVYALIGTTYLYDFLNPGRSIFINRGLVRRSGSGETQVAMKFENQGTVEVVEGALNFVTDQIHTGRYIAQGGSVNFSGGLHTLTDNVIFEGENYNFIGGVLTGGKFTQRLNWQSGTINDLTIGENGRLLTTNVFQSTLFYTGQILNQGYVEHVYRDFGLLFGNGAIGARFVNEGVYALIGSTYLYDFLNPGSSIFINRGLVRRTGSGETQVAMKFENQGTVEVVEGALNFFTDQIHTGRYIAQGGSVNFSGGVHELGSNSQFDGGQFNVNGAQITGDLASELTFNFGVIGDLNIQRSGLLHLKAISQSQVNGQISNIGKINISDVESLRFTSQSALINAGSLNVLGSGTLFTIEGSFSNSGNVDLDVDSGMLLYSDYVQSAGLTSIDSGASLQFASSFRLRLDGGVLTGSGAVVGDIRNSASINPGDALGSLVVSGNFHQYSSGVTTIEIGGLSQGSYDSLEITGSAAFEGLIDIVLVDGFTPRLGDSFTIASFSSLIAGSVSFSGLKINEILAFQADILSDRIDLSVVNALPDRTPIDEGEATFMIFGTPAVGQTLTASLESADPDGNGTFSYGWQASSNSSSWAPIGSNASTVVLTAAEQGKQVRVVVTYTDAEGFSEHIQTSTVAVPFVNDGAASFSISGTPAVGAILSATRTADDPDGNGVFSYQWRASSDGSTWQPVGTDAATYQLTAAEEGKQVRVLAAYTDGEGFTEQTQTTPVAVPLVNDGAAAFSISGTPADGAILSASRTADDPDGNGLFSYQWQASSDGSTWQPVGTGAATYQLTSAEQGKQVRVLVAYTDGEGFTEQVQTSPVAVPFVNDGAAVFSISGTPAVGAILAASLTTDDPDGNGVFSYQWQASSDGSTWQPVGTDAATYQLTAAEEGKQVRVLAAYTDEEGFSEHVQTSPVAVPFVNDGAVAFSISGTPAVGAILSASLTTDDPDGNGVFSYQWQASSDGSTWQPVGTDAATYQLTAAEEGKQVRVMVTYSDGQGFAEVVTAPVITVPQSSRTPTITAVVDNLRLLNGEVTPGGTTNDRTPTISGTIPVPLVRGESLRIFNEATLLGNARVNNSAGTWSYARTLPATAGTSYSIVARVADARGNLGPASPSFAFLLDTTAPTTTAAITGLVDNVGWIQGNVASGGSSDDHTPFISGTLSGPLLNGESLLIFNGSTLLGNATVNSDELTWTYAPTLLDTAGTTYSIVARVSDTAGNLGPASPRYRFRLDITVPTTTTAIVSVVDNVGLVAGDVASGGTTNDRTPTFSGTLSAPLVRGERLRIFNGSTLLGTAKVNNTDGTWSFRPFLPATSGTSYAITARVVDAAGNLGAASEVRTFTLDSTAPATTVAITAVTDDVGLIQGGVRSRRRSDDPTPTLSGTLSEPLADGEVLHVFRGSTWVGSASVDNNAQTWTFTPTLASTAGTSYTFTARVADAVGNLGPVSNTRTFILDTTAPATTATIDAVADNFGLLQGTISQGGRSDDRSPTFTGTLSGPLASGETLRILNGSTLLGSATVNNTARTWSFTPSLPATSGTPYAIAASVADAAGNLGPASDAFTFTLDTTPNPITGTTNDDLLTLTRAADLVTGLEGSDTIVLPRLTDSLLGTATAPTFDHITDLITGVDRIDAPVARTLTTAVNPVALGAVTDLTRTGISGLLTAAIFPALTTTSSAGAATFTFNDPLAGTRTFLAINNGTGGFSATTDAIVEITGFSGNLSQLQVY